MATKKKTTSNLPKDGDLGKAINPYALGELVAQKKINWDAEKDPQKKLADLLGIKDPKAMFKANSPILMPRQFKYNASKDKVEAAAETKDFERMRKFFKKNAIVETVKKSSKKADTVKADKNALPAGFNKICAALFPDQVVSDDEPKQKATKAKTTKDKVSAPADWVPSDIMWKVMGNYIVTNMYGLEVQQGALGDCYFLAALCSVQWSAPHLLAAYSLSGGNYQFRFWTKKLKAEWVTISQKVAVNNPGGYWIYGRSNTSYTETWPALWEKAFAKWMIETKSDCPNMKKIEGGNTGTALRRLTGYSYDDYYCKKGNSNKIWKMLVRNTSSTGQTTTPITVSTSGKDRQSTVGTVPNHAYSILGIETYNGVQRIIVRNPWGSTPVKQYCRSGTWNGLTLNSNGVFSMQFDKFLEYFNYVYYI